MILVLLLLFLFVFIFACVVFTLFLNCFVLQDDRRFKGCFWKDSSCNMILDLLN